MDCTIIHVMRHGGADDPDGVLHGRLPSFGLTEFGRVMAARAAEYLVDSSADIIRVISSPLLRAQLAAVPTTAVYDLGIQSDPRLIKSDNIFKGLPVSTNRVMLVNPRHLKYYCNSLRPSQSESYRDIVSRMDVALSSALCKTRGHETFVTSYQNSIVTLTRLMNNQPLAHVPKLRHCAFASITSLVFLGAMLVDTSYMEPVADLVVVAEDTTPGDSQTGLCHQPHWPGHLASCRDRVMLRPRCTAVGQCPRQMV